MAVTALRSPSPEAEPGPAPSRKALDIARNRRASAPVAAAWLPSRLAISSLPVLVLSMAAASSRSGPSPIMSSASFLALASTDGDSSLMGASGFAVDLEEQIAYAEIVVNAKRQIVRKR